MWRDLLNIPKWVCSPTHVNKRPTPWGLIQIGDIVWMKWRGGPIVAKSVVSGFRQILNSTVDQLRETTGGFRLHELESYWQSLKPRFNAVTIYLEQEEWLDEIIEPAAKSYGNSWIVLTDSNSSGWLTNKETSLLQPIEIPDVSNKRRRGNVPAGLRFRILRRDGFCCLYCGRSPRKDDIKLHVDHIQPVKQGGPTVETNLVTACQDCNLGKSDIVLSKSLIEQIKGKECEYLCLFQDGI